VRLSRRMGRENGKEGSRNEIEFGSRYEASESCMCDRYSARVDPSDLLHAVKYPHS
jgi:hypothetical protein